MSADWERYATPHDTRRRARRPEDNGVLALPVAGLLAIPLDVTHTPDLEQQNRAHTDVTGVGTDQEIRIRLLNLCRVEIRLDDPF